MKIVEVGTFLLPMRLKLAHLSEFHRYRDVVGRALNADMAKRPAAPASGAVIDFPHTGRGQAFENIVFDGTIDVAGPGTVRLLITSLSVGFVIADLTVPDDTDLDLDREPAPNSLRDHERDLHEVLRSAVVDWCDRIAALLPPDRTTGHPRHALPAGRPLWWHRLLIDPDPAVEPAGTRHDGVNCEIGEGRCSVGYLVTTARGLAERQRAEVIDGLILASQEWLVVDEANRAAAEHLLRLGGASPSVEAQYTEALRLTEDISLRSIVLRENTRYMANTRLHVWEAVVKAWRIKEETTDLDNRMRSLQELINLYRERTANERDNRRNQLIFLFTGLTLVQSLLTWYDFLVGNETSVGPEPRPSIAWIIFGITVMALVGICVSALRRRWARTRMLRRHLDPSSGPADLRRPGRALPATPNETTS